MEKKSQEFSMGDAAKLANTPAARDLYAKLQAENPQALNQAMAQAAAGNYDQVRSTLAQMMANPEIRALLKQLGG